MKAKEVVKVLGISRSTLYRYMRDGLVKADACVNEQYRYNEESVYALLSGEHRSGK